MLGKLLTLIGATFLSIALAELLVRYAGIAPTMRVIEVAAEGSTYVRSSNPLLAYEMRPNLRGTGKSLFVPQYTNKHGLRDVERSVSKKSDVRRIILLGDSVVANLDVWETDDQMSRQLERLYSDGSVEVLNFGVGGYCTLAEVELLRTKGLQFQPDLVVLLFVENDFDNFNSEVGMIMQSAGESRRRISALHRSHLARLAAALNDRVQLLGQRDSIASHAEAIGDNNVHQGLELLSELSIRHEFDVLIAIWPVFESDGIRDARFMPDGRELIIEALAKAHELPTVRLSSYFRNHWRSIGSVNPRARYTVGDKMRPNEHGAHVAAMALRTALDNTVQSAQLSRLNNHDLAIELAHGESSSQPDFISALLHGGQVVSAFGDQSQALAHYETAAQLSPENPTAQLATGRALYLLRRFDEAAHYIDRAIAVDPSSPAAHFMLGQVARAQGDVPRAMRHLEKSMSLPYEAPQSLLYPWIQQSHVEFARLLVAEGDPKSATEHLEHALAENPLMPLARFELARLLEAQGAWSMAAEHYRRVLHGYPTPEIVHNNLAGALQRVGDLSAAEMHYRKAVEINPNYAAAWNNLGVIVFARGDFNASEAHFRRALEADSSLKKAAENLEALLQRRRADISSGQSKSSESASSDNSRE